MPPPAGCYGGATLACFDKVNLVDRLGAAHVHVPLSGQQVEELWLASQGIIPITEEEAKRDREERRLRRMEAKEQQQRREKEKAQERARVRWLRRMNLRSFQKDESSDDESGTISNFKGKSAYNVTK